MAASFQIPVLARPLSMRVLVRRYLDLPVMSAIVTAGAWSVYHGAVRPVLWRPRPAQQVADGVTVRPVVTVDERFDELWHVASQQYPIIGVRTARYLRWRYEEHPYYSYDIYIAERGHRLLGYIVTRTGNLLGLRCGIIMDLLVDPAQIPALDDLIDRVVRSFAAQGDLAIIGTMMTRGGPYFAALKRHGFVPIPRSFWFIMHTNRSDTPTEFLAVSTNWYLTWGDTDVV